MLVKTTELQSSCITPLLLTEEIWHICRIYSLFFSGKFPVAKLKKSMCGQDLILPVGLTKAAWKPLQALHSGAWSSVLDQFHILLWEHTAAARENRSLKSYWSYMKKKKKKISPKNWAPGGLCKHHEGCPPASWEMGQWSSNLPWNQPKTLQKVIKGKGNWFFKFGASQSLYSP